MFVIQLEFDVNGEDFVCNCEVMFVVVVGFCELEQKVLDKVVEVRLKFEKCGQLLLCECLVLLFDLGVLFFELFLLVGYKLYDDKDGIQVGGGIIVGIGYIVGVCCLVSVSNSVIKGGIIFLIGLKKILCLQQIVMENKLLVVIFIESGGVNFNYVVEIFVEGVCGFVNQVWIFVMGIFQVIVVYGFSIVGGVYQLGLLDYVVVVCGKVKMFFVGLLLFKVVIGEIVSDEEFGGVELYVQVVGIVEYLVENDVDGVCLVCEIVGMLLWNV